VGIPHVLTIEHNARCARVYELLHSVLPTRLNYVLGAHNIGRVILRVIAPNSRLGGHMEHQIGSRECMANSSDVGDISNLTLDSLRCQFRVMTTRKTRDGAALLEQHRSDSRSEKSPASGDDSSDYLTHLLTLPRLWRVVE